MLAPPPDPGQGPEGRGKLAADLPKAQAAEAKAKAAGHTKLADRIANRITKIQDRETKVNARLSKLSSRVLDRRLTTS